MKKLILFIFISITGRLFGNSKIIVDTIIMGCKFSITIIDKNKEKAQENCLKAINEMIRIENLLSEWKYNSPVSEINRNAGVKFTKINKELLDLINRSIKYSQNSDGYFDITFKSLSKIWKFNEDIIKLPSKKEIHKSIKNINYRNIIIDNINSKILLKNKGMKIGFGSIGKSYAADRAKYIMINNGVPAGLINASGDITTWGQNINKEPWKIKIQKPYTYTKNKDKNNIFLIKISDGAITTSGNYEKFIILNGKKYSHIINPKTGYPTRGISSVTVLGPNAEKCNFYSTSLMVMPIKKGLKLINKNKKYAALIITDNNNIILSDNYKKLQNSLILN